LCGSVLRMPYASFRAELPDLIERASKAEKKREDTTRERTDFREVGDRKKFIDRVNSARKEAYGILSTLPHKHTGLPSNFADQFFKRDRSKVEEDVTLEALEQEIAEMQSELAAKQKLRDEMKQAQSEEEQRRAKEEAEREAAKAELAAIEKEHAEREKKIAALKATIGAKA
jgi:multidrug efflux pump subunit AcrA (membrane-fusion protein)